MVNTSWEEMKRRLLRPREHMSKKRTKVAKKMETRRKKILRMRMLTTPNTANEMTAEEPRTLAHGEERESELVVEVEVSPPRQVVRLRKSRPKVYCPCALAIPYLLTNCRSPRNPPMPLKPRLKRVPRLPLLFPNFLSVISIILMVSIGQV